MKINENMVDAEKYWLMKFLTVASCIITVIALLLACVITVVFTDRADVQSQMQSVCFPYATTNHYDETYVVCGNGEKKKYNKEKNNGN